MAGIVRDPDEGKTTVSVDVGLSTPITVWVDQPVEEVKAQLSKDGWVSGDSTDGEIHVPLGQVKCLQVGKREFNIVAANRPAGSSYV